MKHLLKKLPLLYKNPKLIKQAGRELCIDMANDLQRWPYPEHLINIAALPKSGSTWLFNMLCNIPGYNPCPGLLRSLQLTQEELDNHDISQRMFDGIPKDKFTVLKLHTRPTRKNIELLRKNKVKAIVLIRDLRTMAVSRYVHEKTDRSSRFYRAYNGMTVEDGMWHNLKIVVEHYAPWVEDWVYVCSKDIDTFFYYKYESLLKWTSTILQDILIYYGLDHYFTIHFLGELSRMKKSKADLESNLNTPTTPRNRSTYSGGRPDWNDYYTKEQRRWFIDKVGHVMAMCGYDW